MTSVLSAAIVQKIQFDPNNSDHRLEARDILAGRKSPSRFLPDPKFVSVRDMILNRMAEWACTVKLAEFIKEEPKVQVLSLQALKKTASQSVSKGFQLYETSDNNRRFKLVS